MGSVLKIFGRRGGDDLPSAASPASTGEAQADIVCHCLQVPYEDVRRAVANGATGIADVQRATTACTKCFGCRFEIEALLRSSSATRTGTRRQ